MIAALVLSPGYVSMFHWLTLNTKYSYRVVYKIIDYIGRKGPNNSAHSSYTDLTLLFRD